MFSFGRSDVPAYGGVGVMVRHPGVVLDLAPADGLNCCGPLAQRVACFARAAAEYWGDARAESCEIRVVEAPPQHVGLGTGTQLAMAVALGLSGCCAWGSRRR
ncbi:MAG: hypothetical protein R3C10_25880 [Pirellulales bacterium]